MRPCTSRRTCNTASPCAKEQKNAPTSPQGSWRRRRKPQEPDSPNQAESPGQLETMAPSHSKSILNPDSFPNPRVLNLKLVNFLILGNSRLPVRLSHRRHGCGVKGRHSVMLNPAVRSIGSITPPTAIIKRPRAKRMNSQHTDAAAVHTPPHVKCATCGNRRAACASPNSLEQPFVSRPLCLCLLCFTPEVGHERTKA